MDEQCNEKNCVYDTPIEHGPTCPKSGINTCKDMLHRKEHWTKEDKQLLAKIVKQYQRE